METKDLKNFTFRNRYILFLIFSVFLVYFNSLFNPFIWDDLYLIVKNPFIKNFKFFHFWFTRGIFNGVFPSDKIKFYRPMQMLFYSFVYHIFKLNPFGYHLLNIILHILNTILLYYLLSEIFERRVAFFSSLLFGVHPLNTEAITYISGTADPLFFFFCLLSIRFFLKEKHILSYLFFIFSLLSKETAVIVPFYLIVFLYVKNKINKKCLKYILPFFFILLLYSFFRFYLTDFSQKIPIPFKNRFLTSFKGYLFYLSLIIFPYRLSMERSLKWILKFSNPFFISGFCLFILSIFLVFKFRKKREFIFPCIWFLINFIAISGIFLQLNANFSEHFIYSGIAGILIYVPISFKKIFKKEKIFVYTLCFIAVLYSIRTIFRNYDWKNPEKFFEKTKENVNYPERAKTQLAFVLLNKGKYKQAYEILRNLIKEKPDDLNILLNYGAVLIRLGNYNEAEKVYEKILKLDPDSFKTYHDLSVIYGNTGNYKKAEEYILYAIKINPFYAEGYYQLGKINYLKKNYKKAREYLKKSIEIDPDYAYSYNLLGIIYSIEGKKKEAFRFFRKAVENSPENLTFLLNFALSCREMGYFDTSIKYYRKALQIKPDSPDILNDLGICYAMKGEKEKAIEMWKKAVKINPDYNPAIENLKKTRSAK